MKGIVFNILEDFIEKNLGEDKLEEFLESSDLSQNEPYVGPGTYPDQNFLTLAIKTCDALNVSLEDGCVAFGEFAFPKLVGKYPQFVATQPNLRQFLLSIHDVIHVEVNKLYQHANTPSLKYHNAGNKLLIDYKSQRNLCKFMEGLLLGAAARYKEKITFTQTACKHLGDEKCTFEINFGG